MATLTHATQAGISIPATRAQAAWLYAVQAVALTAMGLALYWSPVPGHAHRMLLAVLACSLLILSLVPGWRRLPAVGVLTGLALALACFFGAEERTWDLVLQSRDAITIITLPTMAPIVFGAALGLAIWGACLRVGLADASRFGIAAVLGGLLIGIAGTLFFVVVDFTRAFSRLYTIESYQVTALLMAVALYPPALWLGAVGLRPARRAAAFLPVCMAVLLGGFLLYWRLSAHGGQG